MTLGNTPIVEVDGILAKLECCNPCGSIKDRIAEFILHKSKATGELKPGQPIIEATSGNTGIAMAYYGRAAGHPVTIVMPENMTEERKALIRGFGADLILCSVKGSFAEAAEIRDRLAKERGWFNPDQFSNPYNVECHRTTTGAELLEQLEGRTLDAFVAGVGTGGTLIGIGEALRERYPTVHLAAVEPAESAVMTGGDTGPHAIYGIGDGFIPAIASDGSGGTHPLINEAIDVSSQDAIDAAIELKEKFQICVGISSGANFVAARRLRCRFETVATVFADGFEKYTAHGLTRCEGGCAHADRCSFPIREVAKRIGASPMPQTTTDQTGAPTPPRQ